MSGFKHGQLGTSLGGRIEMSKQTAKRRARRRRAEEARWKSLNGPVIVTRKEVPDEDQDHQDAD